MRKIVSLLSMLMLFSILAFGQTRTVSGVVRDQAGNPIPFATVTESGTTNATTADERGAFRITIGQNSRLVITSSGFTATTLTPTDGDQTVTLAPTGNLQEVVVTALGIRRKPEEIGYATSKVRPEQITAGRNFNLAQSLSGKVSGLTISNTSASVNATPRIVLRGLRSLTGTNTALIVLDGVQVPSSTINFINPNDVESIDVLKGGQAATLFGSEGVNGAIVITTKKGSQRPEVTVQHTHNVESIAFLPDFNTEFGSGSAYGASPFENFHPAENQQYGDRYDGSIRPIGRVRSDGSILLAPYSYNPGSRNGLFSTGNTGQTDFSYRSGDANSNFFVSYQNLFSNGIVAGDNYNRNSFRLNSTRTYGKVQIGFDANYVFDKADRANTDYYFFALNTPSWIPLDQLTDWRNDKFATMDGWFNDYYNSPVWLKDNQRFTSRNTVFNGNVRLVFKPIEALEFTARAAITALGGTTTTESNSHRFSNWAARQAPVDFFNNNYDRFLTGLGRFVARTNLVGGIGESASSGQRITGDLFGTYRKTFGNLDLTAILGTQAIATYDKSSSVSTNGIGIPELFNLGYSATGLFAGDNNRSETRKIGGFADVTVGFKRLAYLHASFRNDYTSRFYDSETGNNEIGYDDPSFLTYGVDASFIISDIVPTMRGRVVDNLKIRASYNQNGNDNLGAYQLRRIYPLAGGFPYSGLVGTTVGNTLVDNVLTPERVRTAEVGFELGLFANRLSFEGSYYTQSSDKQLLNVSTSSASGGTNFRLNAADLDNTGYELDVRANVFRSRDWNINLNANYSHNTNEVVNIYGETGLDRLNFQSSTNLNLVAEVGQMFPYLRTTAFARDSLGRVIIDPTDGWPERNEELVGKGTTLPIDVLGLGMNIAWKGLTFQANAEYRGGHLVYHDLGEDMTFTGSGAITTIYGRETFIWPNSSYLDPASGKYLPNNNIAVGAYQAMYQGFGDQGFTRGLAGIGETYATSAAFWKIRDISLSYEFPASVIGGVKFIRGITLTAFARNPFTWLPSDNIYTDPEFANTNGNASGVNTSLNTPPTRQFGGVIRVIF